MSQFKNPITNSVTVLYYNKWSLMITIICTCIHSHYHYISVCCDFTCGTLVGSALYWWMSKNATSPWPCLTASAKGVYPCYNRTVLNINNCVTIILGQTKVIIITCDTICYSYLVNLGASNKISKSVLYRIVG